MGSESEVGDPVPYDRNQGLAVQGLGCGVCCIKQKYTLSATRAVAITAFLALSLPFLVEDKAV